MDGTDLEIKNHSFNLSKLCYNTHYVNEQGN